MPNSYGFDNQKGVIAQILLLLFLAAGLFVAVYLVQQRTNLLPKASSPLPSPTTSFQLLPTPSTVNIKEDKKIEVKLYVRSDISPANLFSAKIKFDKDLLAVDRMDFSNSFIKTWVEQEKDNSTGTISLIGTPVSVSEGDSKSGFQTGSGISAGLMAVIYFKALNPGSATIYLAGDSAIYSSADNVNFLKDTNPITITINPEGTPAPSATIIPDLINISTICSDSVLRVSVSGDIPSPSDLNIGLWSTLTDEQTGQSMIYEYDGNQGSGTIHIAANFPATGAIRGKTIPIIGDGRKYTIRIYPAAFTNGIPSFDNLAPVPQATFSKNCGKLPPPTPTPVPTPGPGTGDGNGDGKIDLADLSVLLTGFKSKSSYKSSIDLNGDGIINSFDFSMMRNLLIKNGIIKGGYDIR
ncbi:hypothetical protein HY384_04465 [Candidatus Daviesbacteria bacterium]|nr:hypothetical protein [Candidatus Daviesbacteria bacterium]